MEAGHEGKPLWEHHEHRAHERTLPEGDSIPDGAEEENQSQAEEAGEGVDESIQLQE